MGTGHLTIVDAFPALIAKLDRLVISVLIGLKPGEHFEVDRDAS